MDSESLTICIGDPDVAAVTLSDPCDPCRDGYGFVSFVVRLTAPGLDATSGVLGFGPSGGLGTFLGSLAADWRGWEGTRTWDALEHELSLEARVDPFGHVRLAFTLRQGFSPDAWSATVVVVVEAGEEMAKLAQTVLDFLATPGESEGRQSVGGVEAQ